MADMEHLFREREMRAQAEEIMIYRGLSTDLRKPGGFTICRKNAPDVQLSLTRPEMYALLGKYGRR